MATRLTHSLLQLDFDSELLGQVPQQEPAFSLQAYSVLALMCAARTANMRCITTTDAQLAQLVDDAYQVRAPHLHKSP